LKNKNGFLDSFVFFALAFHNEFHYFSKLLAHIPPE